jgi:hypothetical protein
MILSGMENGVMSCFWVMYSPIYWDRLLGQRIRHIISPCPWLLRSKQPKDTPFRSWTALSVQVQHDARLASP